MDLEDEESSVSGEISNDYVSSKSSSLKIKTVSRSEARLDVRRNVASSPEEDDYGSDTDDYTDYEDNSVPESDA